MSSLHTALSGALSDFGQQLATERERLLSGLVESLAGVQVQAAATACCRRCRCRHCFRRWCLPASLPHLSPLTCPHSYLKAGGAQHATLLQSSLAALQHQRFVDANPRDVDELYDRQAAATHASASAAVGFSVSNCKLLTADMAGFPAAPPHSATPHRRRRHCLHCRCPCRLGERFGEHAQFGKQRALQLLREHLAGLKIDSTQVWMSASMQAGSRAGRLVRLVGTVGKWLGGRRSPSLWQCSPCRLSLMPPDLPLAHPACCTAHALPASLQYEFKHRLLAFLYAASRSPLGAPYSGISSGAEGGSAGLVEVLEQRARTAVVGSPTYLSDAGSDSWREGERGAYSPTSQLSDWEGEEDAAAEGEDNNVAAAREAAANGGAASAAAPPARQPPYAYHTQQQQQPHLQQASPMQPQRQPRRESPYSRTSLSVWLASKASGGQPASLLDPRLCFHERELVQQVGRLAGLIMAHG